MIREGYEFSSIMTFQMYVIALSAVRPPVDSLEKLQSGVLQESVHSCTLPWEFPNMAYTAAAGRCHK